MKRVNPHINTVNQVDEHCSAHIRLPLKATGDNESESLPIILMRLTIMANYVADTSLRVSFIWQ